MTEKTSSTCPDCGCGLWRKQGPDGLRYYCAMCEREFEEAPGPEGDDPERYRHGAVECIEGIRSALTEEEFRGYCKGCAIKYLWRERYKGHDADLSKAADYIDYMLGGR